MALSAPIWIVALALAACAPWCVRAVADGLEGRVRRRTESLVARAARAAGVTLSSDAKREKARNGSRDGSRDQSRDEEERAESAEHSEPAEHPLGEG